MKTFALDAENNIVFGSDINLKGDKEAIVQDVKNLLMMFQTEYPFDTSKGINFYDLASNNDRDAVKNAVVERIKEDSRVQAVQNVELEMKNGCINISCDLYTDLGVINV